MQKDDNIIFAILHAVVLEQGDMQKGGFQRTIFLVVPPHPIGSIWSITIHHQQFKGPRPEFWKDPEIPERPVLRIVLHMLGRGGV